MTLLDTIRNLFRPKPLTPEERLVNRYRLSKDKNQPFTYWLNDVNYINVDPEDPVSLENAEKEIQGFYQNPKVRTASRQQQKNRPVQKTDSTLTKEIDNLMPGIDAMNDYLSELPRAADIDAMGIDLDLKKSKDILDLKPL